MFHSEKVLAPCILPRDSCLRAFRRIAPIGASNPESVTSSRIVYLIPNRVSYLDSTFRPPEDECLIATYPRRLFEASRPLTRAPARRRPPPAPCMRPLQQCGALPTCRSALRARTHPPRDHEPSEALPQCPPIPCSSSGASGDGWCDANTRWARTKIGEFGGHADTHEE